MLVALLDRYLNKSKVLAKIMRIVLNFNFMIFNGNLSMRNKNINENLTD
jgi:hypothetical protein